MITPIAPPNSTQQNVGQNSVPNSSNCIHSQRLLVLHSNDLRIPHFVATCGLASKPNCCGCGPKTPQHYTPLAVTVLSHSFWRLFDCFGVSLVPAGFLTQYIQQQRTDRSHRQVGKRTVMQTHTLELDVAHTQARISQRLSPHAATSNLTHY